MDLYEMFEGWQQASVTAQMTLSILVELMQKQERDITFGAYAKGILTAAKGAPEAVQSEISKRVVEPVANEYAKAAHGSRRWAGYDFTAPEQIFASETRFKDALYQSLIDFLFGNGYDTAEWAMPICGFTSTAKWKLEPY